jgi:hypothetical protein
MRTRIGLLAIVLLLSLNTKAESTFYDEELNGLVQRVSAGQGRQSRDGRRRSAQ